MTTLKEEILLTLEEGAYFLLNPYIYLKYTSHYSQKSFYTTIHRMEKRGLIRKFKRAGKKHIQLTALGKAVLKKHRADANKPQPRWDRKWRLVIFDVPEKKAELRKYLRIYLRSLGFGKVQRSIWISPHDYQKEIRRYLNQLKLSDFVYQLLVDNFEGLSGNLLAASFWDIQGLQNKYEVFCRHWSKRLAKLENTREESSDFDTTLFQRYIRYLVWDYQSILAEDPRLPMELLPADWSGTAAREFVKRWQNKSLKK